jgi:hypothetical protein
VVAGIIIDRSSPKTDHVYVFHFALLFNAAKGGVVVVQIKRTHPHSHLIVRAFENSLAFVRGDSSNTLARCCLGRPCLFVYNAIAIALTTMIDFVCPT